MDAPELSQDAFLGGALTIQQPKRGYRAGVDPVFLAAAVPARPGQSVLELGCGVGTAILCLGRRVSGLKLAGVELQENYAGLARRNADANQLNLEVCCADLAALPDWVRGRSFDHVIANPPYFAHGSGTRSAEPARDAALREQTPLPIWIDAATRRLAPGGALTVIQRADRLPHLISAMDERLGDITATPLAPRPGRPATRVLVTARKGAKSPFELRAPQIVHKGAGHTHDGESYTPEVMAVLREGAAWPWLNC
ncbi:MAG: methyltransferase [Rhodobacteraceae bacterium]|nr:methyltransferase [Paracoccaceae bacterium]